MCSNSKSDPSQQAREFLRVDRDAVCVPIEVPQRANEENECLPKHPGPISCIN